MISIWRKYLDFAIPYRSRFRFVMATFHKQKNRSVPLCSLLLAGSLLLATGLVLLLAWTSTYDKWLLSFPFSVSYPDFILVGVTVLISINFLNIPIIMVPWDSLHELPYWPMFIVFVYMFIIDAIGVFLVWVR